MATEKRFIDANALMQDFRWYMVANFDRERCAQKEACDICPRRCLWHNLITTAPTVDAVEVVRCKDCINAEYFNGVLCCGMAHDVVRQKNDFCSYGERRTDE